MILNLGKWHKDWQTRRYTNSEINICGLSPREGTLEIWELTVSHEMAQNEEPISQSCEVLKIQKNSDSHPTITIFRKPDNSKKLFIWNKLWIFRIKSSKYWFYLVWRLWCHWNSVFGQDTKRRIRRRYSRYSYHWQWTDKGSQIMEWWEHVYCYPLGSVYLWLNSYFLPKGGWYPLDDTCGYTIVDGKRFQLKGKR